MVEEDLLMLLRLLAEECVPRTQGDVASLASARSCCVTSHLFPLG